MANTLATELTLLLATVFTGQNDLSTPSERMNLDLGDVLDNGTGLDQADLIWSDTRTLAPAGVDNLDLAGGSLLNSFGAGITFARIKLMLIRLKTNTPAYYLKVGGGANPFIGWVADPTDKVQPRGNGTVLLIAPDAVGYSVTAGTGDILKIENPNAGSIDYDIVLIGASV